METHRIPVVEAQSMLFVLHGMCVETIDWRSQRELRRELSIQLS